MKAVIIDDEINAVNYLVKQLEDFEEVEVDKTFTEAGQGFAYVLRNECDLLFLDIEMPNISGIYMAEQLCQFYPDMKICFVTAYNEFAVKAFELSAVDYILKPYTKERLAQCIQRITKVKEKERALGSLSDDTSYQLDMICSFDDETIMLLNYDEIYYMEVIDNNVWIHTQNKMYKGNKTLNFYEEKLKNHSFFRTHKCYLVNMAKALKFKPRINYTYDMYFKDIEDVVLVSRGKVKLLKEFFNQ